MTADGCALGIDLGKSWCRAAVLPVAHDRTAVLPPSPSDVVRVPGSVGLAEDDGVRAAASAVEAALRGLVLPPAGGAGRLLGVGIGAAGATAAPDAARALAAALATRTGAPAAVTSDAVTSHAGALGGRAGAVLAVGTGSVAVAVRDGDHPGAGGHVELVDGWGQWLGDEGSGAWIGQQGLRAALRASDGRGPATTLREAAEQDLGALELLPATLAAGGIVRTTAAFAPRVLDAARQGDDVARAIVGAAAARLAETALAAVRRCASSGPTPLAVVGGLSQAGPLLLDPWRTAVCAADEPVEVVVPLGDSLQGAGLLAVRRDLPHESAVVRSDPPDPAPHLEDA